MIVVFSEERERFEAICSYFERSIPKDERWRWDNTLKRWYTASEDIARRLARYATGGAALRLNTLSEAERQAVEDSKAADVTEDIEIPAPPGLAYLPFQRAGIFYALNRRGTLIGDEMGLGKTVQAIGVVNMLPAAERVLIITPASLRLNWRQEILRWSVAANQRVALIDSSHILSEKEGNRFKCLHALDAEIREKAGKAGKNVIARHQLPTILALISKSARRTIVGEASVRRYPIDHRLVRVPDDDTIGLPHPAWGDDASFPVDKAREVGAACDLFGRDERSARALASHMQTEALRQPSQLGAVDTQISRERSIADAGVQLGARLSDLNNTDASAPASFTAADLLGLPRQAELLKGALQGVVMTGDFARGLAECNLPVLYALRHMLRLGFQHSPLFHDGLLWLIVSYDTVYRLNQSFQKIGPIDVLICDEAHLVKDDSTRRAKSIFGGNYKLKTDEKTGKRTPAEVFEPITARRKLFLTGTAIVNRAEDLWPLVKALAPAGLGASRVDFIERYAGNSRLDELHLRLRSQIMVRRLKDDVLKDLPKKRRQIVLLDVPDAASIVAAEHNALDLAKARLEQTRAEIADLPHGEQVMRLRQCRSIAMTEIARVRKETALAKLPAAIEHIRDALDNPGKLVAFAHHHEVLDGLRNAFPKIATGFDGRTALPARHDAVTRFQTDRACRLFIGSKAAGLGVTLTEASTAVFVELQWTAADMDQEESRIHRYGQRNPCLFLHLVIDGSIDAKMARILVDKQAVMDAALDGGSAEARSADILEEVLRA